MISAINCIALEENNSDSVKRQNDSPNRSSRRVTSEPDNKTCKVRRETFKKRKNEEHLKIRQIKRKLNLEYFYDLLFTRKNLKLVHIVCHDKQEHSNKKCDEDKMFVYCDK